MNFNTRLREANRKSNWPERALYTLTIRLKRFHGGFGSGGLLGIGEKKPDCAIELSIHGMGHFILPNVWEQLNQGSTIICDLTGPVFNPSAEGIIWLIHDPTADNAFFNTLGKARLEFPAIEAEGKGNFKLGFQLLQLEVEGKIRSEEGEVGIRVGDELKLFKRKQGPQAEIKIPAQWISFSGEGFPVGFQPWEVHSKLQISGKEVGEASLRCLHVYLGK